MEDTEGGGPHRTSKIPKIRRAHRASATRPCNSAYGNINAEVVNIAKLKTTPPVDMPFIMITPMDTLTTPTSLADTTTSTPLTMSLVTTDSSAPATGVRTVSETVTIATHPNITVPTGVMTPVIATGVTPGVKLPKLTIKKFNGDLTKWVPFWDAFESAIHI